MRIGTRLRTLLISAVFKKSLRLSSRARQDFPAGKIVNIMSTDIGRLDFSMSFAHILWSGPMQLAAVTGLLIWLVGISAFAGLAVILFTVPLQYWASKRLAYYRKLTSTTSDERVKLTQEVLNGIKILKVYSWQKPFMAMINAIRLKEVKSLSGILVLRAVTSGFLQTVPILAAIVTFIFVELVEHRPLTPAIAFSGLALFYTIRVSLLVYPTVVS